MPGARMDGVPDVDDTAASRRGRTVLGAFFLGLVGIVAVLGFVATGTRMPAHATVGGVDVSGMSPYAAREKVRAALGSRALVPITVLSRGRSFSIDPAKAGLAVDVDASVRAAGGSNSLNPMRMARLF